MKTALVTGGSRGIGRAICEQLASAGYSVGINFAGNQAAAAETAALCQQAAGAAAPDTAAEQKFPLLKADVGSFSQCEEMYKAFKEELGVPDVLVNNAGITRDKLLIQMSPEDFDAVITTNLRSCFNMCKLAARDMLKAKHGRIVNSSSVVGVHGNAGQVNYAASKAGVIGLTKSLAKELGSRGITVNAVAPGFVQTDMTAVLDDKAKEAMLGQVALKRAATPQDIANLVVFLASDQAAYITGQVIEIDGGMF